MLTMSEMRLFMMALTCASYGEEGSLKEPMMRQSVASDFQQSDTRSYMEDSRGEEEEDSSDDESMQSRRIQVALKNLVSAM